VVSGRIEKYRCAPRRAFSVGFTPPCFNQHCDQAFFRGIAERLSSATLFPPALNPSDFQSGMPAFFRWKNIKVNRISSIGF